MAVMRTRARSVVGFAVSARSRMGEEHSVAAGIYLDHAASAPLRDVARRAWLAAAVEHQANPTGAHRAARRARSALDAARGRVASALGAEPGEIVFTSGGSEADNLAVRGALGWCGSDGVAGVGGTAAGDAPDPGGTAVRRVAVTTAAEHHAVLHPAQRSGSCVVVGVDRRGVVRLADLTEALRRHPDAAVVSVIAVNNETGSITPLSEVAGVVRSLAPAALLHTDAVQAVNWIDVAAETAGYDLVSVTGHKVGAPVGTGALVVRGGVRLDPLTVGGGQERGRRAGTPDVAGASAFAAAISEAVAEREAGVERVGVLRDRIFDGLCGRLGDRVLISAAPRSAAGAERAHLAAGIANVCIRGVSSEALLFLLDDAGGVCVGGLVVFQRCPGSVACAGGHGRSPGSGAGVSAVVDGARNAGVRRGASPRRDRRCGASTRSFRGRLTCGCWRPCRGVWTRRWPRRCCWTRAMTWSV